MQQQRRNETCTSIIFCEISHDCDKHPSIESLTRISNTVNLIYATMFLFLNAINHCHSQGDLCVLIADGCWGLSLCRVTLSWPPDISNLEGEYWHVGSWCKLLYLHPIPTGQPFKKIIANHCMWFFYLSSTAPNVVADAILYMYT